MSVVSKLNVFGLLLAALLAATMPSTAYSSSGLSLPFCRDGCSSSSGRCQANGQEVPCSDSRSTAARVSSILVDTSAELKGGEETEEEAEQQVQPQCSSHTCSATGKCYKDWNVCECASDKGTFSYSCESATISTGGRRMQNATSAVTVDFVVLTA